MKEARHKRLNMVWIHLYDILGIVRLEGKKTDKYLPGTEIKQRGGL